LSGASGTTGFSGVTGFSGTTGATGATGISGASGLTGRTGMTGLSGGTGTTGSDGFTDIVLTSPLTYYLTSPSDPSGYQSLSLSQGTDDTFNNNGFNCPVPPCSRLLYQGITPSNSPGVTIIFPGTWTFTVWGESAPFQSILFEITLYRTDSNGTILSTLMGPLSTPHPNITVLQSKTVTFNAGLITLQSTDRLLISITGVANAVNRVAGLWYGGANYPSQFTTPSTLTMGTTGISGVTGFSGATGVTGTTGISGVTGLTGLTGFAATGATGVTAVSAALPISTETLTSSSGGVISTSKTFTEIAQYGYNQNPPIYTLSDSSNGDLKYIALSNDVVAPTQVQTNRGSVVLTAPLNENLNMVFANNQWNTIDRDQTWFVTTQQGNALQGSGSVGAPSQGQSVALSAEGNTLAVGGYGDNSNMGAVWIFTRSGTAWSQQGSALTGSGAVGSTVYQGYSVALSADGNTLAIGAPYDNSGIGAAWIFTRSGTVWSQQGSKLTGSGGVSPHEFSSVALSADGNTLACGGFQDDSFVGAVWVFTRSGTVWSQQGSKLTGSGAGGVAYQGNSVALSADGNTLAEGGSADTTGTGAVWIFTRSGTVWSQQGNKLSGTNGISNASQGSSVALSADGNTLAEGAYYDNTGVGAVWVFTRSGSVWSQQGPKLTGSGAVGASNQGTSVTLSADGSTLAEGGYVDASNTGAVWLFTRSGSSWSQKGSKLTGNSGGFQGQSVDFAADANTLAVGAPLGVGSVFIFV
jgi:hypothetical protein